MYITSKWYLLTAAAREDTYACYLICGSHLEAVEITGNGRCPDRHAAIVHHGWDADFVS